MHKDDKEAIAAILLIVGAVVLFVTALWTHAILTGQA